MGTDIDYIFERAPEFGTVVEAAPGVHWLRMALPFQLDHINLWLIEDGDGWTAIDAGIDGDDVRQAWRRVFHGYLAGRPLKRLIVTHFHPDHMGLAGWLTGHFGIELWTPREEWTVARRLAGGEGHGTAEDYRRFYRAAGFDGARLDLAEGRRRHYPSRVSPIPGQYRRIEDGQVIDIGGRSWRVIVGTGHSPEHACLYCAEAGLLISGDQILPRITPNVSVGPGEPDADPLRGFLDSLPAFSGLPAETLVLPSHDRPFRGLHGRLEQLALHHDARLEEALAACDGPRTGVEVLDRLFDRELDDHQLFFAIGESLAHLHFLVGEGRMAKTARSDGVDLFART